MLAIAALVTTSAAISIATVSKELSSVVFAWSLNVRIASMRWQRAFRRFREKSVSALTDTQWTSGSNESFSFLCCVAAICYGAFLSEGAKLSRSVVQRKPFCHTYRGILVGMLVAKATAGFDTPIRKDT
jgi:hypothetical protein